MKPILTDIRVTKMKFEKEVEQLLALKKELRFKGWIIESTSFPIVRLTYIAHRLIPPLAPLTVDIDFTNYNLWPPSVRFLNPVTFQPIVFAGLQMTEQGNEQHVVVSKHPITEEAFLCIQGVREYHSHPQHNGNSWDLYRYTGQGTLFFLLNKIYEYCIDTLRAYTFLLQLESTHIQVKQEYIR